MFEYGSNLSVILGISEIQELRNVLKQLTSANGKG